MTKCIALISKMRNCAYGQINQTNGVDDYNPSGKLWLTRYNPHIGFPFSQINILFCWCNPKSVSSSSNSFNFTLGTCEEI